MKYSHIIARMVDLIRYATNILMVFSLLVFLYGLAKYMLGSDDSSSREESVKFIMYGAIGLFVMASMWGLVAVLTNTFIPGGSIGIPILQTR